MRQMHSLSPIPPGLLTCNRISWNSYISPHNFFQLLHKLATHLPTVSQYKQKVHATIVSPLPSGKGDEFVRAATRGKEFGVTRYAFK